MSVFYSLMMLVFSGGVSVIYILFSLEVLSWIFVFLLPLGLSFNYLIIQGYFLLLSFMGILWMSVLFLVSLLLKTGVPPFHTWLVRISASLSAPVFLFFYTIHKLFPILLMSKAFLSILVFGSVYIFLMGVSFITNMFSLVVVLVFSSGIHLVWMLLSVMVSKGFLMIYWLCYSAMLSFLVLSNQILSLSSLFIMQDSQTALYWLVMSGLPPFLVFWLKVQVTFWILGVSGLWAVILIMSGLAIMSGYFRSWHLSEFSSILGKSNWGFPFILTLALIPVWMF